MRSGQAYSDIIEDAAENRHGGIHMSKKKFQTKYQRVEKKKAYRQKY